jgi:hypothetical protein
VILLEREKKTMSLAEERIRFRPRARLQSTRKSLSIRKGVAGHISQCFYIVKSDNNFVGKTSYEPSVNIRTSHILFCDIVEIESASNRLL